MRGILTERPPSIKTNTGQHICANITIPEISTKYSHIFLQYTKATIFAPPQHLAMPPTPTNNYKEPDRSDCKRKPPLELQSSGHTTTRLEKRIELTSRSAATDGGRLRARRSAEVAIAEAVRTQKGTEAERWDPFGSSNGGGSAEVKEAELG